MTPPWIPIWSRRSPARSSDGSDPLSSLAGEPGFVALDIETTGLSTRRDAIVSAAVVPFVQGVPGPPLVDTLANPGRTIPVASQRIHGISDGMVRDAPPSSAVARSIRTACRDRVVVGHHVGFDLAVVNRYARAERLPALVVSALDVGRIALALFRRTGHGTLDELARRLRVPLETRHTALGDAVIAGRILLALLEDLDRHGIRTVGEVVRLQLPIFRLQLPIFGRTPPF
jgi:DNA polymerase III epsilon subunit-like protein